MVPALSGFANQFGTWNHISSTSVRKHCKFHRCPNRRLLFLWCSCFGKERKEGEECSYLLNVRQFAESETSRYGGHRRRMMVSYRNIWHRCCCNAPPLADACRPSNPSSFLNSWYGSPFRTRATSMVPPPSPSLSLLCCVLKQIPHFQCSKLWEELGRQKIVLPHNSQPCKIHVEDVIVQCHGETTLHFAHSSAF